MAVVNKIVPLLGLGECGVSWESTAFTTSATACIVYFVSIHGLHQYQVVPEPVEPR